MKALMYQQIKNEARCVGAKVSLALGRWLFITKGDRNRIVTMRGDWLTAARAALEEIA